MLSRRTITQKLKQLDELAFDQAIRLETLEQRIASLEGQIGEMIGLVVESDETAKILRQRERFVSLN